MKTLKNLAMQAKNRLRGEIGAKALRSNIKLISPVEDESLYEKVRTILSGDEEVLNPIARIMDMNIYKKLDEKGKEKYFFLMVEKYHEMLERYNSEKKIG